MQADWMIEGGRVVNVFSGEILEQKVAVAGERIIEVSPDPASAGPRTKVIDAGGGYILPGFFDAHAHADLFYNPQAYAGQALTQGVTGFFNDGHDLASALGVDAFLHLFEGLAQSPLSIYTGAPAAAPPYPGVEGGDLWPLDDLAHALDHDFVLGISEVTPYTRLAAGAPDLMARLDLARKRGKFIEGHTTGANLDKLNRLALSGITSCHEALNSDDVLSRLRLGYYVMLRQGSIRQDLPNLMDAVRELEDFDLSRVMLVSDGIFADHLLTRGNLDWVLASAVELGMDPVRAIQMVTLNPARYFRLDHLLGSIAPGRLAHILIAPDLKRPTPRMVMASGRILAGEGAEAGLGLGLPAPDLGSRPFTLSPPRAPDMLIPAGPEDVPVITIIDRTVTGREEMTVPVRDGFYCPQGDLMSVLLFSRDGANKGGGIVKGYCPGLGGMASTTAHETHGLLVAGQDENDMALAAAEVLSMGGGMALVQGERVLARMPLDLGGICSTGTISETARDIETMHQALAGLGCNLDYPLWTFVFLSFTSVYRMRITYEGVYDIREGKVIF